MPITKASSNAVAAAAKGDLVVGNATNDSGILAVGSTDQVLTVDSTTATGLKWATASAGGMTVIASGSIAASATGLDLTSISSAYTDLRLFITDLSVNATGNGEPISFRLNNDSGANYESCNLTVSGAGGAANGTSFLPGGINGEGVDNTFIMELLQYADTTSFKIVNLMQTYGSGSVSSSNRSFGTWCATPAAINRITMTIALGAFDGGSYTLYGVK